MSAMKRREVKTRRSRRPAVQGLAFTAALAALEGGARAEPPVLVTSSAGASTLVMGSAGLPVIVPAFSSNGRLGYEDGRRAAEAVSLRPWKADGFVTGCIFGPAGCLATTDSAWGSPVKPALIPRGTSDYRFAYEVGYEERLRERRASAATHYGAGGTSVWAVAAAAAGLGLLILAAGAQASAPSGRPLREGHELILPGVAMLPSFGEPRRIASTQLTKEANALASSWLGAAKAEAASVPAFMRLAMELRALDAPAALVRAAEEAAADEVRHAEICFRAVHDWTGVEAHALPLSSAPRWKTRTPEAVAQIARESWLDGCVLEATAAVVAERAFRRTRDEETRARTAPIARDEARHAELAWSVLAWAARDGGVAARDAIAEAASGTSARTEAASRPDLDQDWLTAHGHASASEWNAASEETLERARHRLSQQLEIS